MNLGARIDYRNVGAVAEAIPRLGKEKQLLLVLPLGAIQVGGAIAVAIYRRDDAGEPGKRVAVDDLLRLQNVVAEVLVEQPQGGYLTVAGIVLEGGVHILTYGGLELRIADADRLTGYADVRTRGNLIEARARDAARVGESARQVVGEIIAALQGRESVGVGIAFSGRRVGICIAVVKVAAIGRVRRLDA